LAHKATITPLSLTDPTWSVAEARPGDPVDLSVTVKNLQPGQKIEIRIKDKNGTIAVLSKLTASGATQKGSWTVPNTLGSQDLVFDAVLREEPPNPKNGQVTTRGRVTSGKLKVHGFKVAITSADAAFAPGPPPPRPPQPPQERLHVKIHVDSPGGKVAGKWEIWGERYPTMLPLYTESFTPAVGHGTWDKWDGVANAGPLAGKYISPEFSPYRVRVIIGVDQASVDDPRGKGKGKVCMAEQQFEVAIESLGVHIQEGLPQAVKDVLKSLLAIEPRSAKGTYADLGRLPAETETGRVRIPNARHYKIDESLSQGDSSVGGTWAHRIADAYMDGDPPLPGPGKTKFQIDGPIYTRVELPIEIETRLRSRDPSKNGPGAGVYSTTAVGPAIFDVFAEDVYDAALYAGAAPEAIYLLAATTSVKSGAHYFPMQSGGKALIDHWQERFKIAADGDRDLTTVHAFVMGLGELTVYLNRARLTLGANADFVEVNASKIKLAEHLTKRDDVLWIVRTPLVPPVPILLPPPGAEPAPAAVASWVAFPPGDNCHAHYGGIRGATPNPTLLKDFSPSPAGTEPIRGKGGAFPYATSIDRNPDADPGGGERVEAKALVSGANLGLAGIIFSPSTIAGDGYRLTVTGRPYERSLGALPSAPVHARTGEMNVWRFCQVTGSFKLPAKGTHGLPASVGIDDPALAGRAHPGDATGLSVSTINAQSQHACTEWDIPVPPGAVVAGEPHQELSVPTYVTTHNGLNAALTLKGFPALAGAAALTNDFVQWDPYRDFLPPNLPANRVNVVSNAIARLAVGSSGTQAMSAAQAAITAHDAVLNPMLGIPWGPVGPDAVLAVGVTAIALYGGGGPGKYLRWVSDTVDSAAYAFLDALTPKMATPKTMQIVRWPIYYKDLWKDGTPGAMAVDTVDTGGFCRGDGQSYFATIGANPDVFEHEMGHSLHLCHFVTGSATNSCWKHHDNGYAACKMGYNNRPLPVARVPQFYTVPPPAAPVGAAIQLNTGARNLYCARCLLKMRGWNELVLPCNWTHPDVF
jgi:hypothetical protein